MALRHQGRLNEAYDMAQNMTQQDPGAWADTALFWVLHDMVLQAVTQPSEQYHLQADSCLQRMEKLQPHITSPDMGKATISKLRKSKTPHSAELAQCVSLSKTDPAAAYHRAIAVAGKQAVHLEECLHEDFGWILYRYLKSQLDRLTSVEVRCLLRDYMLLKNPSPSMLHSSILNFALNFSKQHADFVFPNFLKLWGCANLRKEDLHDTYTDDNKKIPSLLSRICSRLATTDTPMTEEMITATGLATSTIVDMYRTPWFWDLNALRKSNETDKFWKGLDTYARHFGRFAATEHHSKILRQALWVVDEQHTSALMNIVERCKDAGLHADDWTPEEGKDGNTYLPFAVRLAKKCFEYLKKHPHLRGNSTLSDLTSGLYDALEERHLGDEWTARQRAIISVWRGNPQAALAQYRHLLKTMGDKYYIWQEMAQCVDDASLRVGFQLRALHLAKTDDLISPLRLQTAQTFLEIGRPDEAKKLLEAYARHRKSQDASCPDSWRRLSEKADAMPVPPSPFDAKTAIFDAMNHIYAEYPWRDYVLINRFDVNGKPKVAFSDGTLSFTVSPKRFAITRQTEEGTVFRFRCMVDGGRTIPLMAQRSDASKWSILPRQFGHVVHVNTVKSIVSMVTAESKETFFPVPQPTFKVGDFITFHSYKRTKKDNTTIVEVINPVICPSEEALPHFPHRLVAVGHVNPQKELFHVVMGNGQSGDVIKFKHTALRPHVGDILRMTYCTRQNREGQRRLMMLDLQPSDETCDSLVREVNGSLQLKYKSDFSKADFGFVNDYYVPQSLLQKENIYEDCEVCATAVAKGGGKWEVFRLERI